MLEKEPLKKIKKEEPPETADILLKPELRLPKEIEGWIELVEKKDANLTQPIADDQTGQILVTSPNPQSPKIILPLEKQKLLYGLKQKINEAIRWLAEWCLRLIKMKPERVTFKKN